jgi:hypothetical protein
MDPLENAPAGKMTFPAGALFVMGKIRELVKKFTFSYSFKGKRVTEIRTSN